MVLSVAATTFASAGLDHPVDVSAGRVVDEGIDAVPVGVASVKDIRLGESDRYVTVGVRRIVMFQSERGIVQLQSPLR
jgi:hypothetical protein